MAGESGGIVQFIKLALDRASLRQLEVDATAASQRTAQRIAARMGGTGPEGDAVVRYVTKIRQTFERNMEKIRSQVAEGLIDIPKAERQADRLARAFSTKLEEGLARFGKKTGMGIGAQLSMMSVALPSKEDLAVTRPPVTASTRLVAEEAAKMAKNAANTWAANFAPIVHRVLTSDATWDVKTVALAKLGVRMGDEWAAAVRGRIAQLPSLMKVAWDHANSETRIGIQTNLTGYAKWQQAVRDRVNQVKSLFKTVNIPDEQPVDPFVRARLKKSSPNNTEFQRQLQLNAKAAQLAGAELTKLGRLASMFGIDVMKSNPQVQALTARLKDLGASSNQINGIIPRMQKGFMGLSGTLLEVAKGFGLIYSARRAIEFMKETVQVAAEAEVSWARLSASLADYGVKLSDMMPEIQPVFDQQERLGIAADKSAESLSRLVQITGDAHGSLRALPVVQDMVASGFMNLESATKAVGRAMLGDTMLLGRQGIYLDKTKDAVDQLAARFGGELLQRSHTLTGSLERMGVAWRSVRIEMGRAFAPSDSTMIDRVIDMIHSLKDWVDKNAMAFKLMGVIVLAVLGAIGAAIFGVVAIVTNLINVIATGAIGIRTLFISIPGMAKTAMGNLTIVMTEALQHIAGLIDKVFGSHLAQAFDKGIEKAKKLRDEGRKEVQKNMDEGHQMVNEIWNGSGPLAGAPDSKLGSASHARAREHEMRRRAIADARLSLMSDDLEARARGEEKLAKLEQEINDRKQEEAGNSEQLILLDGDMLKITQAREALQRKLNNHAKEEREEAKFRSHLTMLAHVAREADDKEAIKAVHELNQLHDQLLKKRKGLVTGSEEWLKNENNIKTIEDGLQGYVDRQDQLFNKRVERLGQMVDLEVNRKEAVQELNRMYDEQQAKLDDAQKRVNSTAQDSLEHEQAINDAIAARAKQVQIEAALRREMELPNEYIDQLEKDLKIAEKRTEAVRELVTLQRELQRIAREGKTKQQRDTAQGQVDRITGLLEGQKVDIPAISHQITAARELIKHGKTRADGLKLIESLEAQIDELLTHENLTEVERARLIAQRAHLGAMARAAEEPNLDVWDEFKYMMSEELPKYAEEAAGSMADVFQTAFQGIMRDSRNLNHALSSIPKGMAKAMLDELAKMAQGKAKENLAWALEETAKGIGMAATGNFAGAGEAFASAGQHVLAAAKWGLLGGAAGALGQSATTAYGNATDFASNNRGSGADSRAGQRGPDIYLSIDGVDPKNPRHQQLVGDASREYNERYGGRLVYVK